MGDRLHNRCCKLCCCSRHGWCPILRQIRTNKRYAASMGFTVSEVAEAVKRDVATIDVLVHSLANGPEVAKPLLETSRKVRALL